MDLVLTTFSSRKNPKGTVMTYTWEDLVSKLSNPVYTLETMDEYEGMTNEQKTDAKDVGGFVGGKLRGGVRRKSALEYRSVLTIDADNAGPNDADGFSAVNMSKFFCHTTHTSTDEHPRLRWVFPLSRPVTADEYPLLAREVSKWVGVDTIDESTDQPERLMFWPSVPLDGEYKYWQGGSVLIDPDELLLDMPIEAEAEPAQISSGDHTTDDASVDASEGRRNKTVFSFAATLRGSGLDYQGIRSMVSDYNDRYCDPPLPEAELDTICRSVCGRYAPGEAVVATLRDAWDDFNDLGEWKETPKKAVESIQMESLLSLHSRSVAPPKFVVPGTIPYGITILASPPKFGKSWMMLDLAISVATGTQFLGLDVQQTGVIYLALEDGDYRLQDRSKKVAGQRPVPDNLYLVKEAPILEEGLLPKLNAALERTTTEIGMIIIDTLQKVRGTAKKTEGVYGYDYRELGALHQFALDRNLAVVLVHHLNKGGDDSDFVSRLKGSRGVSGAADTIITLTRANRKSDETKMSITGRDVQERTLILQMDWSAYRWICLGDEKDVADSREEIDFQSNPFVKTILFLLQSAEDLAEDGTETVTWSCTSNELIEECERLYGKQKDIATVSVGREIQKLAPQLESKLGILYEYRRTHSRREHVFTRDII